MYRAKHGSPLLRVGRWSRLVPRGVRRGIVSEGFRSWIAAGGGGCIASRCWSVASAMGRPCGNHGGRRATGRGGSHNVGHAWTATCCIEDTAPDDQANDDRENDEQKETSDGEAYRKPHVVHCREKGWIFGYYTVFVITTLLKMSRYYDTTMRHYW